MFSITTILSVMFLFCIIAIIFIARSRVLRVAEVLDFDPQEADPAAPGAPASWTLMLDRGPQYLFIFRSPYSSYSYSIMYVKYTSKSY